MLLPLSHRFLLLLGGASTFIVTCLPDPISVESANRASSTEAGGFAACRGDLIVQLSGRLRCSIREQ